MLQFLVGVSMFFAGTTDRVDDVPKPIKALVGSWGRASYGEWDKDGNMVTPVLQVVANGKSTRLYVGGTPPTVYWNPGPSEYSLVIPADAAEGELAVVINDASGVRQVRFTYTVENDTLMICCKEKIQAGPWLGKYDISGKWVRARKALQ